MSGRAERHIPIQVLFFWCEPAQVRQIVIRAVPVDMVSLRLVFRVRNEGFRKEAGYGTIRLYSVIIYQFNIHGFIAVFGIYTYILLHNPARLDDHNVS